MLLRPPARHFLDSYAIRHLVLGRPQALAPLSTIQLGARRFRQRCRVTSASGEEAVLSFDMALGGGGPRWGRAHARRRWPVAAGPPGGALAALHVVGPCPLAAHAAGGSPAAR
jgi:hypothetical protein